MIQMLKKSGIFWKLSEQKYSKNLNFKRVTPFPNIVYEALQYNILKIRQLSF